MCLSNSPAVFDREDVFDGRGQLPRTAALSPRPPSNMGTRGLPDAGACGGPSSPSTTRACVSEATRLALVVNSFGACPHPMLCRVTAYAPPRAKRDAPDRKRHSWRGLNILYRESDNSASLRSFCMHSGSTLMLFFFAACAAHGPSEGCGIVVFASAMVRIFRRHAFSRSYKPAVTCGERPL